MHSLIRLALISALFVAIRLSAADALEDAAHSRHNAAPLPPETAAEEHRAEMRRDVIVRHGDRGPMDYENVTFLGVETAPVSKTLIAQLNLPNNAGLVVVHVVPNSAAAGALQENDILLKLDDQILIDQHQLMVLVRNHKDGDEVTLTYVRSGKQATARVKLTKHDVPKFSEMDHDLPAAFAPFAEPGESGRVRVLARRPGDEHAVDTVLGLMHEAPSDDEVRVHIDRKSGPAVRAMRVNPANSNIVYSDDNGSLELKIKDGRKILVAKNAKGDTVFNGPVTTPDERKALPGDVRERLEKLESTENMTFRTDGDFEGAETKVLRPQT